MRALKLGRVLVEFEDIGEGWNGEHEENDPADQPLLRFNVYRMEDGAWAPVDDASYCTRVPVDTPDKTLDKLLLILMDRVYDLVADGLSVKQLCEELSWIEPSWADKVKA